MRGKKLEQVSAKEEKKIMSFAWPKYVSIYVGFGNAVTNFDRAKKSIKLLHNTDTYFLITNNIN